MQNPPKKLLDQVRDVIRLKHYSYRTEETYVQWIVRYILFHNKRHPKDMGVAEIEEFLTHLAVEGNVAAATQNQALNAILFLYRQVLQIELADRINAIRAKRPQQIPIVLSPDEAFAIIQQTTGVHTDGSLIFKEGHQIAMKGGYKCRSESSITVKSFVGED